MSVCARCRTTYAQKWAAPPGITVKWREFSVKCPMLSTQPPPFNITSTSTRCAVVRNSQLTSTQQNTSNMQNHHNKCGTTKQPSWSELRLALWPRRVLTWKSLNESPEFRLYWLQCTFWHHEPMMSNHNKDVQIRPARWWHHRPRGDSRTNPQNVDSQFIVYLITICTFICQLLSNINVPQMCLFVYFVVSDSSSASSRSHSHRIRSSEDPSTWRNFWV